MSARKPDYKKWARMDRWSKREALLLINDIDPSPSLEELNRAFKIGIKSETRFPLTNKRIAMAPERLFTGTEQTTSEVIDGNEFTPDELAFNFLAPESMRPTEESLELARRSPLFLNNDQIAPLEVINWALNKKLPVPPELAQAVYEFHYDHEKMHPPMPALLQTKNEGTTPPCLLRRHGNLSPSRG